MNKYIPIYLYGAIIILEGIFLMLSKTSAINIIQPTLGITLTIGGILAFIAAFSRQRKQVQFAYHEMHALAMMVYGVSILLFCDTYDKIIFLTSFLFIFYAFSEIIFCIWLFNLAQKVSFKILIVRVLLGFAIGIGTVFAMNYSDFTLEIFGVLFIMVGTNIILYVPVMKEDQFHESTKGLSQ